MGWQASQILSCRVRRASQWIACLLTRWIISLEQRLAHPAAQHVVFVLIQRGQLRWRRMPASRDIWATGIHAVDLTAPSFLVRLDCCGEGKIAAARFTGFLSAIAATSIPGTPAICAITLAPKRPAPTTATFTRLPAASLALSAAPIISTFPSGRSARKYHSLKLVLATIR